MEQDLHTLSEYLRSLLIFGGVPVAYYLVFYVVSCALLFVCLSFYFSAMALSVYFRSMGLIVPLISFAPLLWEKNDTKIYKSENNGFLSCYINRRRLHCIGSFKLVHVSRKNILQGG